MKSKPMSEIYLIKYWNTGRNEFYILPNQIYLIFLTCFYAYKNGWKLYQKNMILVERVCKYYNTPTNWHEKYVAYQLKLCLHI